MNVLAYFTFKVLLKHASSKDIFKNERYEI